MGYSVPPQQMLRGVGNYGWDAPRVSNLLAAAGVPETVRPEVLSPAAFVQLHRSLVDGGWSMR